MEYKIDQQTMLLMRLCFEAGVHRGETKEKYRLGDLDEEYVAPDFNDIIEVVLKDKPNSNIQAAQNVTISEG